MFTIIGADQKQYGPVSADEVRQWIRDGRADGRTMALAQGTSEWKPLSAFPEFASCTSATGTPPRLPGSTATLPTAPATYLSEEVQGDFNLGECLGRAWELLRHNFGLLVGASALIWLLEMVVNVIPFAGAFLGGVLYGGLYLLYLKRIRGQAASLGDGFAGFSQAFIQLLLAGFVSALLTGIAYLFCMFPWVYFKIAWIFCLPLVIDKRLEFWTAMELSRKVVTRVWLKVFCLALVAYSPTILFKSFVAAETGRRMYDVMNAVLGQGTPDLSKLLSGTMDVARATATLNLAAQMVLLVNLPFATGALMYAYEALFGPRSTAAT
jgi:hypothetical protein